ncbi:aspartate/glutamate racemase family protein [Aliibacillus thermotolerans]|uniref:Aspartate/glutamate racemase family protein n=1 Tax=Aliibacillus thermotolerans TaxID=1834418 RepID=A0ABW0U7F0_9BACI|nr:amino acid racemase [Aliibacillus thermotolerans]MDA3129016.1 amino acid racemase [Aliibacillus thermotolerans]
MKRVGIIGGLGPESTVEYYQTFIKKFQNKMNSNKVLPELFINSINMYNIFRFIDENKMTDLIDYVGQAAQKLEEIGADVVVISANTPHIVFADVQNKVNVPMISIVEATYEKAVEQGMKKVGLLGTKFTMEHDFFKKPFLANEKEVIVPNEQDQMFIHEKIVEELENGIVKQETKEAFLRVINTMMEEENIDGLILGCTELPMILNDQDVTLPLLNTTEIHIDTMIEHVF